MAYFSHNLEALQARRRHIGSGAIDYALIVKPIRKLGQIFWPFSHNIKT